MTLLKIKLLFAHETSSSANNSPEHFTSYCTGAGLFYP
jgi:hypothetical protein